MISRASSTERAMPARPPMRRTVSRNAACSGVVRVRTPFASIAVNIASPRCVQGIKHVVHRSRVHPMMSDMPGTPTLTARGFASTSRVGVRSITRPAQKRPAWIRNRRVSSWLQAPMMAGYNSDSATPFAPPSQPSQKRFHLAFPMCIAAARVNDMAVTHAEHPAHMASNNVMFTDFDHRGGSRPHLPAHRAPNPWAVQVGESALVYGDIRARWYVPLCAIIGICAHLHFNWSRLNAIYWFTRHYFERFAHLLNLPLQRLFLFE
jgi:hypothetical protein